MTGQRNYLFPLLAGLLALLYVPRCWAAEAPQIVLPDPFAVELPAGVSSLGANDEPISSLIATAHAEPGTSAFRVTAALPKDRVEQGVWRVIWSAWDNTARDRPVARRESFLFVLPHGMTPVAFSGKTDATAGNNATHIVRDSGGFIHMVWTDSWRPGAREGPLYRRARVLPDGTAHFETDSLDLAQHPGNWTAIPSLTTVGNTIHFAWQTDGTVRYRSLTQDGDAWRWTGEVDTKAPGPGRDTGPSIEADANGLYILSPAGVLTMSRDGGRTWSTETVPLGPNQRVKTASLTLDHEGRPLVAASVIVAGSGEMTEGRGYGAYWTLRLARRTEPGKWEAIPSPIAGRPEWAAPEQPDRDVLADWVRVLADRSGGLHATWHGTAVSRLFANDRAYYSWRPSGGSWSPPVQLREVDPAHGVGWSYAPSMTLDEDHVLPLEFYLMRLGQQDRGFDSELGLFRAGKRLSPPLTVTRFARDSLITGEPANALSAWFPGLAPSLFHDASGRVWADVLMTLVPTGVPAPNLIVWQRLDLTDWLKAAAQ